MLEDTEAKPTISAIGHMHIDIAWLWRVAHTRDKAGRSFATALALMQEYPDFVFMYNQAVLLNFLKDDYPALWAQMITTQDFDSDQTFTPIIQTYPQRGDGGVEAL